MLIVWGSFKGELGKKECDGVSEGGGGWYPNAHYISMIGD